MKDGDFLHAASPSEPPGVDYGPLPEPRQKFAAVRDSLPTPFRNSRVLSNSYYFLFIFHVDSLFSSVDIRQLTCQLYTDNVLLLNLSG